ncbi:hypothetical protein [Paenibacillus sp. 1P03SA]
MRHALNGPLKKRGGHIGYVIRPAERGKGYAKLLLQSPASGSGRQRHK